MNKVSLLPDAGSILSAAITAGKELGLDWEMLEQSPQLDNPCPDAWIRLRLGKAKIDYAAQVKRALRPATLGAVLHQLTPKGENTLLVADYVTPPLAEELRARRVQFIDTVGNAYLTHPPLLVWVKGQRPREKPFTQEPKGRVFQPIGLKVVFSLLCRPELADQPYRDIAAHAGVAHGTVGGVVPELMTLRHLTLVNGRRRLLRGELLLNQWVEAYARTLRPKLLLGRYRAETLDWTAGFNAAHYHLLLGGEPAAQALTGHLRPGTATLYGSKVEPRLLLDQHLQPDARGNVEIMKKFWAFDPEIPGLAPLILVYADLLAIGDARCLETAEQLRGQIVDRFN